MKENRQLRNILEVSLTQIRIIRQILHLLPVISRVIAVRRGIRVVVVIRVTTLSSLKTRKKRFSLNCNMITLAEESNYRWFCAYLHFAIFNIFSDLPPSQGGKYSGFGYTREQPPRSQSQELFENTMSSLANVNILWCFLICVFLTIAIAGFLFFVGFCK